VEVGSDRPGELDVDGTDVYLAVPDRRPAPGVVVLHEIFGLNDDIRAITRRFASLGYVAAAPDLVGGGRLRCIAQAMIDLSRGHGPSVDAAVGVMAWLAARPDVAGGVGVAGFCMGGSFALLLGTRDETAVVSAAYGDPPKDAELAARLCPTVAHYGDRDLLFRAAAPRLERTLTEAGTHHDVRLYHGVGHSFMNHGGEEHPVISLLGRPLMHVGYDPAAAEDAWERIGRFFAEHLPLPDTPPG